MKVVQSSIFRAVVAFIVGVLLVKYREDTMKWITITAGLLFFVSGLISCAVYYLERRKAMNEALVTDKNGKVMVRRMPAFPVVVSEASFWALSLRLCLLISLSE